MRGLIGAALAALLVSGASAAAIELVGESRTVHGDIQDCAAKARSAADGFKFLAPRIGLRDLKVHAFERNLARALVIQIDYVKDTQSLSAVFQCDDRGNSLTRYMLIK